MPASKGARLGKSTLLIGVGLLSAATGVWLILAFRLEGSGNTVLRSLATLALGAGVACILLGLLHLVAALEQMNRR